jgi:uroporphyrinogen decarboxylase
VSTLIAPDAWRHMFKPRHARLIQKAARHQPELIIIMHSDGAVAPLIDDFIEIGIDVYNPGAAGGARLRPGRADAKVRRAHSLLRGIDQQALLPEGDAPRSKRPCASTPGRWVPPADT